MGTRRKTISVITPCFNEEDNIMECYETIKHIFEKELPGYDREHLFCDNASTDKTPDLLRQLAARDEQVKVILNARNFGPFCSTFNGLMSTTGAAVVVFMPADLQDPPELIPEFVKRWEDGHQIVYGIRKTREEGFLMRWIRGTYYRLVSTFAAIRIPPNVSEFQLIDRVVVEALRGFDDYYPYIRGMIASCGFRSVGIEHNWRARKRGFSKNRFFALVDQGLNGLISFTRVPIRLCLFAGFILSFLSISYALINFLLLVFGLAPSTPPGIATLLVALFTFSGIQLFFFGVLGEYIAAIHSQVRRRPLVIEKERINFDQLRGQNDSESASSSDATTKAA